MNFRDTTISYQKFAPRHSRSRSPRHSRESGNTERRRAQRNSRKSMFGKRRVGLWWALIPRSSLVSHKNRNFATFSRLSNRPRNGWPFGDEFRRTQLPQPAARSCAATRSDNSKPSRPLHAHRLSPNPFSVQSSLLYPLTVCTLSCFRLSRAQSRCSSTGRPADSGGVTAPATSRSTPRACGEESRRRPEPRAPNAEDPSRRRRAAPSAAAKSSP